MLCSLSCISLLQEKEFVQIVGNRTFLWLLCAIGQAIIFSSCGFSSFFLLLYMLDEPILHLLMGLYGVVFFRYNFPKPELIWMKPGIQVRRHGAHSHEKMGEIAPAILPKGAKSCFVFFVFSAMQPSGHLSCANFYHF